MKNLLLFKDGAQQRDPSLKDTDKSALQAIVQAAVNVELFTIPLYMTSLYSLCGTHQITSKDNDFYRGRLWPGKATVANPRSANDRAFNAIFSVFIAEMLHLQLASNICTAVQVTPSFTSPALQTPDLGWKCYGPDNTVIPHIIDLRDTIAPYDQLRVKLDAVNKSQIGLFLAIEETEEDAKHIIQPDKLSKYFPTVPFSGWKPEDTETDLPMFGSIGHMYLCLWEYLSIRYSDGTTLWESLFTPESLQQDLFNTTENGHAVEYPGLHATISSQQSDTALMELLNMINGITDQGEGKGIVAMIKARIGATALQAVQPNFQPDKQALEHNYPSYSGTGQPRPSRDAAARSAFGSMDHYETFQEVMQLLETGEIMTWDQWHDAGNTWNGDMLKTEGYNENTYPIPPAEEIAAALNRLKQQDADGKNYQQLSYAATGAISGVTTVLNNFWKKSDPQTSFPFPSMAGSGDRMSICWAIFGKAPDLGAGIKPKQHGILYHACQGLNLDPSQHENPAACATVEVFHTCKGSNTCKGEGGCGFVQSVHGGGGCSAKVNSVFTAPKGGCGLPNFLSVPSDNKCGALGGCAVPISASQMYPEPPENSKMELFDFTEPDFTPEPFDTMEYTKGELVYDVAWNAFCKVLQHRGQPAPDKPAPSDLRLAFPPST